ncbi:5-formyltetrahydrofolate cyclo-ligase [Actinoplanes sp. CA-252034]|uniref:5-formyltetrahydrofolate cyclo-ligase n=1 Tax=Actinoplanes sp. CA-252034 TaxID=3239906 RepID=UPI003D988C24
MPDLTPDAEKSHQIKISLRARLLTARRSFPVTDRLSAARQLQDQILSLVRRTGARSIAAYVPVGSEPGGPDLPDRLLSALPAGGRLLLPVLLPDNDLTWAEPTPPAAAPPTSTPAASAPPASVVPAGGPSASLVAGPRGLREPGGPRLGVEAVCSVDLLLVPALAVGNDGTRMGRGGGSYDRVLARLPEPGPLVVALLHDGEDIVSVPAEPHDRRVHAVITPTGGLSRRPCP